MKRDFQRITPEAAGIPSVAVAAFIDRLEDKMLPMHSILLEAIGYREGHLNETRFPENHA